MKKIIKFILCDILGIHISDDQYLSNCKRCNRRITTNKNGRWIEY